MFLKEGIWECIWPISIQLCVENSPNVRNSLTWSPNAPVINDNFLVTWQCRILANYHLKFCLYSLGSKSSHVYLFTWKKCLYMRQNNEIMNWYLGSITISGNLLYNVHVKFIFCQLPPIFVAFGAEICELFIMYAVNLHKSTLIILLFC